MKLIPTKVYLVVWLALIAGFLASCGLALIDLGPFNVAIALGIAIGQMLLVMVYFMQLRHSSRMIWLFAATGFYWIGVLFLLGLNDYLTRGWRF